MTLTLTCHTWAKLVYGFYIVVFFWCQINLIPWLKSTQVSLTSSLQRQLALLFSYFITFINSLFSGFPSYVAQVFPQLVTYKIWHSYNSCAAGGVLSLNFESVMNSRKKNTAIFSSARMCDEYECVEEAECLHSHRPRKFPNIWLGAAARIHDSPPICCIKLIIHVWKL